jgi:hypothetical protein
VNTVYCFDILTAKDYYERLLKPIIEDYKKDRLSSSKALMCAMLLWHFAEWIFHSQPNEMTKLFGVTQDYKKLRDHIISKCEGYHFVGSVGLGSKHFRLTDPNHNDVKQTGESHGHLSGLFGLTESHLFLQMKDDKIRHIDTDIISSMNAWEEFIRTSLPWQVTPLSTAPEW